jgi:hypothetical protein
MTGTFRFFPSGFGSISDTTACCHGVYGLHRAVMTELQYDTYDATNGWVYVLNRASVRRQNRLDDCGCTRVIKFPKSDCPIATESHRRATQLYRLYSILSSATQHFVVGRRRTSRGCGWGHAGDRQRSRCGSFTASGGQRRSIHAEPASAGFALLGPGFSRGRNDQSQGLQPA